MAFPTAQLPIVPTDFQTIYHYVELNIHLLPNRVVVFRRAIASIVLRSVAGVAFESSP